jgi:hypothetical protein
MDDSFNPYQAPASTTMPLPGGQQVELSALALEGAATGLRLVFVGVLVELLTSLAGGAVGGLLGVMQASGRLNRAQFEALLHSATMAALVVASIGLLLRAAGRLRCLTAARETGRGGVTMISAGILLAAVALRILHGLGLRFPGDEMISSGAVLTAMLLFLVFLHTVAERLGSYDLASRSRAITVLCWVSLALWLPTMGIMLKMQPFAADGRRIAHLEDPLTLVMALLMIGLGLLVLVLLILYLILVARLRTTVLRCEPVPGE